MLNVKVAFGTIVQELKDVSKSYKEAKMALDVGKIFYAEKKVVAYSVVFALLGMPLFVGQSVARLSHLFFHY